MFIDFENRKKNTFKTRQRSKYVQFRHKLVWNSSPTLDPPKNSFIVQKSQQTLELHQIQIHQVDLRARFSNLVDLLKRCFTKLKLVELEKKIPTTTTDYTNIQIHYVSSPSLLLLASDYPSRPLLARHPPLPVSEPPPPCVLASLLHCVCRLARLHLPSALQRALDCMAPTR